MSIYDSSGDLVSTYSGSPTTATTTAASATGSLYQTSYTAGGSADYQIYYTTVNPLPAGASFKISYPSSVTPSSSLTDCYVIVDSITYSMTCSVDTSTKTVSVSGGLT